MHGACCCWGDNTSPTAKRNQVAAAAAAAAAANQSQQPYTAGKKNAAAADKKIRLAIAFFHSPAAIVGNAGGRTEGNILRRVASIRQLSVALISELFFSIKESSYPKTVGNSSVNTLRLPQFVIFCPWTVGK